MKIYLFFAVILITSFPAFVTGQPEELTPETFQELINDGSPALVLFYATWCRHSRRKLPVFLAASNVLQSTFPDVRFVQINADEYKDQLNIELPGYPTVWFLQNQTYWEFEGKRTVKDLKNFLIENQ